MPMFEKVCVFHRNFWLRFIIFSVFCVPSLIDGPIKVAANLLLCHGELGS